MGKDTHGKYHPPKGKPSDTSKEDGWGPAEEPGSSSDSAMQIITVMDKTAFEELALHPADVCVTIYVSARPGRVELNEEADRTELKRVLQEARHTMEELKIEEVIDDILQPAYELIEDEDLWHNQAHGMALFLAPDLHRCCLLPYDPGNEVHVHTSFILIPLAAMLNSAEAFYLLVLSKHAARLYMGDQFHLRAIDIPEMPAGMEDVVHVEEKADQGKPVGEQTLDKKRIVQYFREVDRSLRPIIGKSNLPLLTAGVEYLLPLYREANSYPHLMQDELRGNYEHVPVNEIFELIHPKMQAWFDAQRQEKIKHDLDHGTAPVTVLPADVIRAAFEGRIAQLFVARGPLLWGQYSSKPEEPVVHAQEEPGDDCLTNQAVVQSILHGGQAFVVDKEQMPAGDEMAAVLRYG